MSKHYWKCHIHLTTPDGPPQGLGAHPRCYVVAKKVRLDNAATFSSLQIAISTFCRSTFCRSTFCRSTFCRSTFCRSTFWTLTKKCITLRLWSGLMCCSEYGGWEGWKMILAELPSQKGVNLIPWRKYVCANIRKRLWRKRVVMP
jgi:hypothetical protein